MKPRTYESLETKIRRLAGRVEEAQQRANLARVRISAAQLPEIPDLNRALEVIELIGLEAGGLGAELAGAQRSEKREPSQVVRSGAGFGDTLGQAFDRLRGEGWSTDRELILLRKGDEYAIIHAGGQVTVISVSPNDEADRSEPASPRANEGVHETMIMCKKCGEVGGRCKCENPITVSTRRGVPAGCDSCPAPGSETERNINRQKAHPVEVRLEQCTECGANAVDPHSDHCMKCGQPQRIGSGKSPNDKALRQQRLARLRARWREDATEARIKARIMSERGRRELRCIAHTLDACADALEAEWAGTEPSDLT